jgi:hypothetical protein
MAPRIRAIHSKYSRELESVGRLLTDYGELELSLFNCVVVTKAHSFDRVFKQMFATRGEKQRIDTAAKLGGPEYDRCGFKEDFTEAVRAMDHCRLIRNQYAHAYWHNPGNGLCFVDLEGLALQTTVLKDLLPADFRYVDQTLLNEQEDFFTYTEELITHANYARRKSTGENVPVFSKPAIRKQPALFIP